MDTRAWVVVGIHAVIGVAFMAFGVLGLTSGAEPAAAGLRFVLGVLVFGLGFAVARLV